MIRLSKNVRHEAGKSAKELIKKKAKMPRNTSQTAGNRVDTESRARKRNLPRRQRLQSGSQNRALKL